MRPSTPTTSVSLFKLAGLIVYAASGWAVVVGVVSVVL